MHCFFFYFGGCKWRYNGEKYQKWKPTVSYIWKINKLYSCPFCVQNGCWDYEGHWKMAKHIWTFLIKIDDPLSSCFVKKISCSDSRKSKLSIIVLKRILNRRFFEELIIRFIAWVLVTSCKLHEYFCYFNKNGKIIRILLLPNLRTKGAHLFCLLLPLLPLTMQMNF